jgi:O-antigen ligase
MRKYLAVSTPAFSLWTLVLLQHLVVGTFLLTRNPSRGGIGLSMDIYLAVVGFSTLIFAIFLAIQLILYNKLVKPGNLLIPFAFSLPTLTLYIAMFINEDLKTALALTFLILFIAPYVLWISNQETMLTERHFNLIIIVLALSSFVISVLQVLEIIPVAQLNVRESIASDGNRPTGLFFNAFALSTAAVMTYLVGLYNLVVKNKIWVSLLVIGTSLVTLVLAATRTSLYLAVILTFIVIFQKKFNSYKKSIFATFAALLVGVAAPFLAIPYGIYSGNQELATLNGRTTLWDCVLEKSGEFIPFGVGVDAAFPQGFCVSEGWFSRLRHPENMFLLSFVEAGFLGLTSYLFLFAVAIWASIRALKQGYALSLTFTATFLMSSTIYVSMFHYVPFLANRTADRGIFNFYIFVFLWLIVLAIGEFRVKNEIINRDNKR